MVRRSRRGIARHVDLMNSSSRLRRSRSRLVRFQRGADGCGQPVQHLARVLQNPEVPMPIELGKQAIAKVGGQLQRRRGRHASVLRSNPEAGGCIHFARREVPFRAVHVPVDHGAVDGVLETRAEGPDEAVALFGVAGLCFVRGTFSRPAPSPAAKRPTAPLRKYKVATARRNTSGTSAPADLLQGHS